MSLQLSSEKSNRQLEIEVSELNGKLSEAQRELRDVTAQRNRLQQEVGDVTPRVAELENQLITANKAKLAFSKQLENARKFDDDESAVKARVEF